MDETNKRGIPSGVGSGAGWQKIPELVSTATSRAVGLGAGGEGEDCGASQAEAHSAGVAMAMAVDIRCAITHPTIFSRVVVVIDGIRNKYAFDVWRMAGVSGGEDSAMLTVSSRVVSYEGLSTYSDEERMYEPWNQFCHRRLP